jgi:hypothetical protein
MINRPNIEGNHTMYDDMILCLSHDFLAEVERNACTDDYCFICGRCTDHFAEHSDLQLLNFANGVAA